MSSSSSSGGGSVEHIDNISSGWNYLAVVQIGDNAAVGDVWEFCVGADTQGQCSTGNRVWDPDIGDEIDSDWVPIKLTISLNGSGSKGDFTVDSTMIEYSQSAYTRITNVQIQAIATGLRGEMLTRWIKAVFSSADGRHETVAVDDSMAPEGNNSTGSGSASQAIRITPFSANYDTVTIDAQVRLVSFSTVLPPPNSLTAAIYVYTARTSVETSHN